MRGLVLSTLVVLLISLVSHLSIARWLEDHSTFVLRHKRRTRLAAALLACVGPGLRFLAFSRIGLAKDVAAIALIEVALVMCSGSPLGIMKTGFWLYGRVVDGLLRSLGHRRAQRIAESGAPEARSQAASIEQETSEREAARVSRRQVLERVAGVALLGSSTGAIGWGVVRGRHAFQLDKLVVKIPGLPRELEGYVIAQISDVHTGTFVEERELENGLAIVRSLRPDLVVATGDLVDHDARYAELFARTFGRLQARDGLYAILGNHDYTTGAEAVRHALARAGIPLLCNQGHHLRAGDGGGFALLGVDDLWGPRWGSRGPDLDRAIAQVPGEIPRILLAHQPVYFRKAAGRVALQLSGHTHGGQINPGFRPASLFMEYVAGRYERSGSTLYVNRGFGVAGPPSRVGAPPEITQIVLVSG